MRFYDFYLIFLFVVKMVFLVSIIQTKVATTPAAEERLKWAHTTFKVGMALLLVYLFRPNAPSPIKIETETKLFLFIFGALTLFEFFKEYKETKNSEEE